MNSTETMKGQCLCGAVSIETAATSDIEICHCGMCRRWSGGPLMAIHGGPDMQINGSDNISTFNSSEWAERGFCKICGTHLFYHLKSANEYVLPAGLFQDQESFQLKEQIFIDKKPTFYEFINKTPSLTEAEVFAKFAPK